MKGAHRPAFSVAITVLVIILAANPSPAPAAAEGPPSEVTASSTTSTSTSSPGTTSTTATTVADSPPDAQGKDVMPSPVLSSEPSAIATPPEESGDDQPVDLPAALPPASADDTAVPREDDAGFPASLQAQQDSVTRTGSSSSDALVAALAPLIEQGVSAEEVARVGFGRFPVGGKASYSHDWWFPRFGPGWRLHEGTDIFAAKGTPVRAPVEGTVRISNGGLGGLAVYVTASDGTYFYLAHLSGTSPGLTEGSAVSMGDLVGYVGDSGNARGGLPHVHFEVHPRGGGPVDPKPVLDRLLADARAAVPLVVEAYSTTSDLDPPELPEPNWPLPDVPAAPQQERFSALMAPTAEEAADLYARSAPLRPIAHLAMLWAPDIAAPLWAILGMTSTLALLAAGCVRLRRPPSQPG